MPRQNSRSSSPHQTSVATSSENFRRSFGWDQRLSLTKFLRRKPPAKPSHHAEAAPNHAQLPSARKIVRISVMNCSRTNNAPKSRSPEIWARCRPCASPLLIWLLRPARHRNDASRHRGAHRPDPANSPSTVGADLRLRCQQCSRCHRTGAGLNAPRYESITARSFTGESRRRPRK